MLGMVRTFDEFLVPGQELDILVNVMNYNNKDLEDVKITVFIPELPLYFRSGTFDVESRESYGKLVFEDIPEDAEPGDYLVRVTVSNDDFKKSVYRYITIV